MKTHSIHLICLLCNASSVRNLNTLALKEVEPKPRDAWMPLGVVRVALVLLALLIAALAVPVAQFAAGVFCDLEQALDDLRVLRRDIVLLREVGGKVKEQGLIQILGAT
jgi:hypothetical protein